MNDTPSNVVEASTIRGKYTLIVCCPFCTSYHHHPLNAEYLDYLYAPCGKGYYVIRVENSDD